VSAGFTVGRGRTAEIDVAAHRSRYERRVEPGIEREREREREREIRERVDTVGCNPSNKNKRDERNASF
jgi:hypothetical protein